MVSFRWRTSLQRNCMRLNDCAAAWLRMTRKEMLARRNLTNKQSFLPSLNLWKDGSDFNIAFLNSVFLNTIQYESILIISALLYKQWNAVWDTVHKLYELEPFQIYNQAPLTLSGCMENIYMYCW